MKKGLTIEQFHELQKKKSEKIAEPYNLVSRIEDIIMCGVAYTISYGVGHIYQNNHCTAVMASTSLDSALSQINGLLDIIKGGMIAVGLGLISICTIKNIIANVESSNRQKAISCLVDGAVIGACLYLVDVVLDAIVSAFGG